MYYYGNNIIGIYMLSYPPCDIVYNMSIKTHNEYVICIYYVINYFRVKSLYYNLYVMFIRQSN